MQVTKKINNTIIPQSCVGYRPWYNCVMADILYHGRLANQSLELHLYNDPVFKNEENDDHQDEMS